jgi:DnaJ-domain-containing protein 1
MLKEVYLKEDQDKFSKVLKTLKLKQKEYGDGFMNCKRRSDRLFKKHHDAAASAMGTRPTGWWNTAEADKPLY